MNRNVFDNLLAFLEKLEKKKIGYTLAHNREEAIMVLVAVPGERWEIEFMRDGSIEVEKFISTGEISDTKSLNELFARYTDSTDDVSASHRSA
jgi:hypothetical protein